MLHGYIKRGFSAYSSPVMLISRKFTKDKRVVTDFRHLNVRIAKNNLAYPLVRHFLSVGKFKMQGVLCVGSKRCLSFTEIIRTFKEILWNTSIFWQFFLFVSKNANGVNHLTIYMAILY